MPRASVVVLSGNRPDAIVTVAWEISWYQYRVEAEHGGHVRLEDRGDDPGVIDQRWRDWNAQVARRWPAHARLSVVHGTEDALMRLTELASDLEALRTDIADELLAINRYEQQTFTLTDEETRETVARILDERKQHVALLLGQLRRLDPKQREKLDR